MFDREIVFDADGARTKKFVSGSEPFALGHYSGDPDLSGRAQSKRELPDASSG